MSWEEAEKLDYRALAKAGGRRGKLLNHSKRRTTFIAYQIYASIAV